MKISEPISLIQFAGAIKKPVHWVSHGTTYLVELYQFSDNDTKILAYYRAQLVRARLNLP